MQRKIFNLGFGLALAILIILGALSCWRITKLVKLFNYAQHTNEALESLRGILSIVKDAETGQRGYIITGEESFLEDYHKAVKAISQEIKNLRILTADDPGLQQQLDLLESLINKKLDWMREKIDYRKYEGFEPARKMTLSGKGKELMDNIRKLTAEIENEKKELLKRQNNEVKTGAKNTIIVLVLGASFSFALLILSFYLLNREITECSRAHETLQKSYHELEVWVKDRKQNP